MKRFFFPLVSVAFAVTFFAAAAPGTTITDVPTAEVSLRRAVSPKMYNSLRISPVSGWVLARGQLTAGRVSAARVVRSDLGGEYDSLALELAKNLHIIGEANRETEIGPRYVNVYLLIYDIADGRLGVSFANLDDPAGGWRYYGGAWMSVQKDANTWVPIEHVRLARNEQRGPRTYTIGVVQPAARKGTYTPDPSWHRRFQR
jgi:hypothetical protein